VPRNLTFDVRGNFVLFFCESSTYKHMEGGHEIQEEEQTSVLRAANFLFPQHDRELLDSGKLLSIFARLRVIRIKLLKGRA